MNLNNNLNDLGFINYPQKGNGQRPQYDPIALDRESNINPTRPMRSSFYYFCDNLPSNFKNIITSVDPNDGIRRVMRKFSDRNDLFNRISKEDFPGYLFFIIKMDKYNQDTIVNLFDAIRDHYNHEEGNFTRNLNDPDFFIPSLIYVFKTICNTETLISRLSLDQSPRELDVYYASIIESLFSLRDYPFSIHVSVKEKLTDENDVEIISKEIIVNKNLINFLLTKNVYNQDHNINEIWLSAAITKEEANRYIDFASNVFELLHTTTKEGIINLVKQHYHGFSTNFMQNLGNIFPNAPFTIPEYHVKIFEIIHDSCHFLSEEDINHLCEVYDLDTTRRKRTRHNRFRRRTLLQQKRLKTTHV
jgi:hypothetical protein